MPRKLPRHVNVSRAKGKIYFYFRVGKGPRTPLPGRPGDIQFEEAYLAALNNKPLVRRAGGGRAQPFSIGALIASYKESPEYVGLKASSKIGYNTRLETMRRDHGDRSVAGMTREGIVTRILQPFADRPGAAHDTLKKLRILVRHAINIGWLKHDPSIGIKRSKLSRIRSWTEDEIEIYRKRWALGTKQRTAFELFLNTGQRRSDVVRMAWPHITPDNKIAVTQRKTETTTGRRLLIPLHRDALAALAAVKREHVSINTTAYGKPFTVDGFSQWMRDAITAAGLPLQCQPHGLRKATGRRLAEAGATAKMIMSILGHTTLAEAERYTEEADQIGLAEDAVIMLEAHKANRVAQTNSRSLGKGRNSKGKSK